MCAWHLILGRILGFGQPRGSRGTPLRPGHIGEHFGLLARKADLPPVRFHDLRHGAAAMLIAAGQPIKVVSAILGHSTSAFTMDVYAVLA